MIYTNEFGACHGGAFSHVTPGVMPASPNGESTMLECSGRSVAYPVNNIIHHETNTVDIDSSDSSIDSRVGDPAGEQGHPGRGAPESHVFSYITPFVSGRDF